MSAPGWRDRSKGPGGIFANLLGKKQGNDPRLAEAHDSGHSKGDMEPLTILVPPRRRGPPAIQSITPGRSLTSSVLGRGPTPNVHTLYRFGKRLGRGQFGTAYLCHEINTGTLFACKTIARSSLISEEDVEDIRAEVNIMYHLANQPNIVQIKGTYEDRQSVHIVMELCQGGELFDDINARVAENNVPYTEKDAARLAKSLIRSVERCHAMGVIHRDIKPENFLLTTSDSSAVLKMADFGLAAFFSPGQTFSRVCGSAMYMAPEVIQLYNRRRATRYGPSVDVFSAGIMLYILLSGSHPFPPAAHERNDAGCMKAILKGKLSFARSDWEGISADARYLIRAMLHPDPQKRPTAQDVLNHPWIERAPEEPLRPAVVERFRNFLDLVRLKKFKQLAVRAMARTLEKEMVVGVMQRLADEDRQNAGLLPVEALLRAVRGVGAEETVGELTTAVLETGVRVGSLLEYSELLLACQQLCEVEQQEALFRAFALLDTDLSGYITKPELKQACQQFRLTPRLIQELSSEVNRDEAGRLDYNEFVALMRKEAGGVSRRSIESSLDDGSFREKEISDFADNVHTLVETDEELRVDKDEIDEVDADDRAIRKD